MSFLPNVGKSWVTENDRNIFAVPEISYTSLDDVGDNDVEWEQQSQAHQ